MESKPMKANDGVGKEFSLYVCQIECYKHTY